MSGTHELLKDVLGTMKAAHKVVASDIEELEGQILVLEQEREAGRVRLEALRSHKSALEEAYKNLTGAEL
jgi:hypothetical protein